MSEVEIEQKDYFTIFGQKISNNGETIGSLIIIPIYLLLIVYFVTNSFFSRKGEIIDQIKSSMNDPDSFKLREFKESYSNGCNDTYLVKFSGKNSFGGTVTHTSYVIYKNDKFCIMGDWGSGNSLSDLSDDDFMEVNISSNGCSC